MGVNYSSNVRRISRNANMVQCGRSEIGLFPHPYDCTKFLNCNQGITVIQDCGAGSMFNPAHRGCDYPQNVNCPQNSHQNAVTETPQSVTETSVENSTDSRRKCALNTPHSEKAYKC